MNNSTIFIKGKIVPTIKIKGKTNASIIRIYPELENIEITPTLEDQKFKSEMYGFNEINVKGVSSYIDGDIKPEYIKEGVDILGVVGNYKGVDSSDATATPEDILARKTAYVNNEKIEGTMQEYNGDTNVIINDKNGVVLHIANKYCKDDITVEVDSDEINVNPTIEEQIQEGLFHKVTIGPMLNTSDATATAEDILLGKTAYVNGKKIEGKFTSDSNSSIEQEITGLGLSGKQSYATGLLGSIKELPSGLVVKGTGQFLLHFCTGLEEINLDCEYIDNMNATCIGCSSLKRATFKNTHNVTNMQGLFLSCSSLVDFDGLDVSNVTIIKQMFEGCTGLTDETLNKILLLCTQMRSYTGTKTLKIMEITKAQATRCQSLSNYQAFLNAGWTTGY